MANAMNKLLSKGAKQMLVLLIMKIALREMAEREKAIVASALVAVRATSMQGMMIGTRLCMMQQFLMSQASQSFDRDGCVC